MPHHHGHHHGHAHGCCNEHEHEHEHHHGCDCHHEHTEHEHTEHQHEHHHEHEHEHEHDTGQHIFILQNLGCANCAAKIEQRIRKLPGVKNAGITFATRQLRLDAADPEALLPKISAICTDLEPDIVVIPKKLAKAEEMEKTESPWSIMAGAALFAVGLLFAYLNLPAALPIFVAAYLLLGGRVLLTALGNIRRGQVFDENFLMSIATLGAFGIQEYPEAVGVMLFYRIGEFFEHRAVAQSRRQIMAAAELRPDVITRLVGNDEQIIAAEDAQVGDILLIRPGDRIPLDGVIITGESSVDTAPVTGEPLPQAVAAGSPVISGCVNISGRLTMRVEKVLQDSTVSRILDAVENAAASKPQIDRFITRFARIYTPLVVALAVGVAVLPPLIMQGEWLYWLKTALTFLVISCPCALVLSVPLAFFSGIGAASKQGILFKGGSAIEALAKINAVVLDKTGTLTHGQFTVQKIMPAADFSADELLQIAAACELSSTHPIAVGIVAAAGEQNLLITHPTKVEEIAGHGIKATTRQGEVLCGNQKLLAKFGVDLSEYRPEKSGAEVLVAVNGQFVGHILIDDSIKEDAAAAVKLLQKQGISTAMLTGDTESSANAVAAQTGIDEVHAHLLPQDKLQKLQEIRSRWGRVMFVGDGINDAPVLAGADVGAAMGSGADAALEAADVVFMTNRVQAIPQVISLAKNTCRVAWQNIYFALAVKLLVVWQGLNGDANLWLAVFADTGVAMLCLLNSIRLLYRK